MSKPLSLRKNFSWTFFGNTVFYICQWAILVILAKLGNPQMLGVYSYSVAIAVPFTLLGKLQLQAVFVTDVKDEYLFTDYLVLRLLTTVLSIAAIAVVAVIIADSPEAAFIIIIVGLGQGFLCIREMYLSAMQKVERMDALSISNVIQGFFSLIVFFLAIRFSRKLLLAVLGLLIARIATFILYDYPVAKRLYPLASMGHKKAIEVFQNWKGLIYLVWLSLPVGITSALITLQVNIPQYFIKHYYGETMLGYYAAMASLLSAGHMVIGALGQSACPRLAKYFVVDKVSFSKLLAKLVVVGIALGLSGLLLTWFFGKLILKVIFSADYAIYWKEFNWIMLSGAIAYTAAFFGYGMTAARYFKMQAVIWMIIVGITAISCYLFVPSYSIKGAAWAMSIALIIGTLLIFVITVKILQKQHVSVAIR